MVYVSTFNIQAEKKEVILFVFSWKHNSQKRMIHLSCLFLRIWVRNCVSFFLLFFSIFTHEKAMGYVNRSHKFSCFCKEDEYCQGNSSRGVERGELIAKIWSNCLFFNGSTLNNGCCVASFLSFMFSQTFAW